MLKGITIRSTLLGGVALLVCGKTDAASAQGAAPAAVAAQPAAEEGGLAEIIVTAQKRSESVNKVGMSISALSSDTLARRGVSSAEDLVKVVPGFNYTQSSYGAPVYTLRGIGFYDTSLAASPTVSVYVDEVPLPYSTMATGASLDLERVEVLKGPQGTLFGQNATGGAINYIAAKPTTTFKAGGDLSVGRFGDVGAQGFVSGPLSDTLSARLAVRYDHGGDWQRSYTRDDKIGGKDLLIGRLLLDWRPADRLKISVNLNGWRDRSDNQAAQFIAVVGPRSRLSPALLTYPVAPANDRAADWDAGANFQRDNNFYQASLRADYDLDFATLTSISSYEHVDRDGLTDGDGTALKAFNVQVPGRVNLFSQEVRLAGDLGMLKWVLGGNYQHEKIEDAANASFTASSFPFNGANAVTHQTVDTWAIFANASYEIMPSVTLQGGIRYTDRKDRFSGCTYDNGSGQFGAVLGSVSSRLTGTTVTVPPGGCGTLLPNNLPGVASIPLDETNVSWRTGVNWQAGRNALLYVNVSKGYKAGAFPVAGATSSLSSAPATQESVLAYEAGFKLGLLDRKMQLNGAIFYYDYADKQIRGKKSDPNGIIAPFNALVNVPKSSVTGAELQATVQPVDALTLNIGATYIKSKIRGSFVNYNPLGQLDDFGGEAFPLTPKWQISGDAEYRFPLSADLNGFVGGNFNYQSATNAGFGDLPLLAIKSYTLVDARVGVRQADGRWNASLFVRNVGNTYYWNYVSTTSPDVAARLAGRPRTYGVTVGFRY